MNDIQPMRVLVACEESQEVCKAFRALGHEAYSCDIEWREIPAIMQGELYGWCTDEKRRNDFGRM